MDQSLLPRILEGPSWLGINQASEIQVEIYKRVNIWPFIISKKHESMFPLHWISYDSV